MAVNVSLGEACGGRKFRFAIDRGGTFTDVWAKRPDGVVRVLKLLSVDPANYSDAPREGIRRILEEYHGHPVLEPIGSADIEWIRMGTTVATNALLERTGERVALVVTKGFKDLLFIGNQTRPNLFDLKVATPEVLYQEVIEVEERLVLHKGNCNIQKSCQHVFGVTGEKVEIWQPINLDKVRKDLAGVLHKGIKSIAVALMHSYLYDVHEVAVGEVARELGFEQVSLSSKLMPMSRVVPRGYTACADAYLTPNIRRYVSSFASGFDESFKQTRVLFMQSDGGLTDVKRFSGAKAILSGPAGGVVGYALTTCQEEASMPIIGFDMGGTSTDVSRYAGTFEHVMESTTAGVTIQAPQLDVNTVAAGGGSRLFFRSGMFVVGPESASAHPGPVCYRKGGPLALTDANLVLGRVLPEYFPKIFGKNQDEPLDKDGSLAAFRKLTEEVNQFQQLTNGGKLMTVEQVAMGFVAVANETMCRPIRALTQGKGYDTSKHVLACFGGAGGQHACAIARSLGMSKIFIHKYAGILSAYGMALADVVFEEQEPCAAVCNEENFKMIMKQLEDLAVSRRAAAEKDGFVSDEIHCEYFLHMRYKGTDCALMCSSSEAKVATSTGTMTYEGFVTVFLNRYKQEFGFTIPGRDIIVDDVRVRCVGKSERLTEDDLPLAEHPPVAVKKVPCYFDEGYLDTDVYILSTLRAGHVLQGPSLVIDQNNTVVIEPGCWATLSPKGTLVITVAAGNTSKVGTNLDAIQLSIFSHRFMSIAEQMGRVLQRTAISTNIKERLDFSCAMFGPDGGLVANAPHIPVHLGAMQETVQFQMKALEGYIFEGDVILSNHPQAGGSHLPDLTVITPVFYTGAAGPVFFVASRGHHADIGGITPGSMPPHSTSIFEEGAVFMSFKIVERGVFQEDALVAAFQAPGKRPGCSGTRNLHDNISDLRAQVAANQKGITLIKELIDEYGLDVVQAYMAHIQANAEVAVRDMMKEIARTTRLRASTPTEAAPSGGHLVQLHGHDHMDDGTDIQLSVTIDDLQGSAVFDFLGTGLEVFGNCNAPRAITLSAIIYCLRCMVGHDVPLNQGCLKPVTVHIPRGSILDPSETAAVVGGNVLTSQRIVDVIFRAFGVCAASQGCMNNITFGDDEVGYYETVAGGAGAGPTWDGRSGVHTHMTNTRITDPEVIERRYPIVLQRFSLRPNSGGKGLHTGGDGVVREMLFRKDMILSVLTERRVFSPYGLHGGGDGHTGSNTLTFSSGRAVNLGSKKSIAVSAGDVFRLETPGGGGYGCAAETEGEIATTRKRRRMSPPGSPSDRSFSGLGGSLYSYKLLQESA